MSALAFPLALITNNVLVGTRLFPWKGRIEGVNGNLGEKGEEGVIGNRITEKNREQKKKKEGNRKR